MNKILWIVILVVVLGGLYWSMNKDSGSYKMDDTSSETSAAPAAATATDNALSAGDQKAGKEVMIASLSLKEAASVVVHADAKGPGEVIGSITKPAGVYTNLVVPLTKDVKAGDILYPMLHPDNGDGKYTSTEEGSPLLDAAGKPIMVQVTVK